MASNIRNVIIESLADGQFVSGQELANDLSISRAAISNHIAALIDMGLDIYKVRGKGYKLAHPIQLLDKELINKLLIEEGNQSTVETHRIIDSTNSYLLRKLPNQLTDGSVCLAEYQHSGRGRRGRQWHSPFGSHLYLSMYKKLPQGMSQAMGLSLVIGLAIKDCLSQLYQLDVQLKWPNDVYINHEKIAGILIELEGQPTSECHCIIGVGLNINMPQSHQSKIDQPWTDITKHWQQPVNRNELAVSIISKMSKRIDEFLNVGFGCMQKEWCEYDVYYNQPISILTGQNTILGTGKGVNEQGALLLESEGKVKAIYGGEVSVRAASK